MQAQNQDQGFNDIQIDEDWISEPDKLIINPNLLMCQICYGIPLQQYAECQMCGRIFCEKDYKQVQSSLNACPNCKNTPFSKKIKSHILYANIFSRIVFECKLCNQQSAHIENDKNQMMEIKSQGSIPKKELLQNRKKYNKQQLSDHINDHHKKKIMDFTILYDFELQYQKGGQKIIFDMYQNIQLNQVYEKMKLNNKKKPEFSYQLDSGDLIVINFQKEIVTSPMSLKVGRLTKRPSKTLKKNVDYEVWATQLDVGLKYYSLKYQEQFKKEHEEFIKNHRKNEFIFDIGNQRYRISFSKMTQINTYTEFSRKIHKTTVKFV